MRLFVAIDIPENILKQLQKLRDTNLDIRWTTSETIHLTLRFIGNIEEQKKEKFIEKLADIRCPAFNLFVKGLDHFPSGKKPKIVWVGLEENSLLADLQNRVEDACQAIGIDPEDREYHPHITIGRVKGANEKNVFTYIQRHKKLDMEPFPVREFILFDSKLNTDGAIHESLRSFPLKV